MRVHGIKADGKMCMLDRTQYLGRQLDRSQHSLCLLEGWVNKNLTALKELAIAPASYRGYEGRGHLFVSLKYILLRKSP